jgi:hypothetical protein
VTVVKAVSDAFDAEAKKWRDLKPVMDNAAKSANDIVLTPGAFFAGTDITAPLLQLVSYDNLKDKVHALCTQAAAEYSQLEQAMIRAKNEYIRVDGDAAKLLSPPIFGN